MRDFERIEERSNDEEPTRFVALWAVAAVALLMVILAVLASLPETEATTSGDPLDVLAPKLQAEVTAAAQPARTDLDPKSLTFHQVLLKRTDPEVAAAVEAASAELEHPDPLVANPPTRRELAATLPAVVTAGPDQEIVARAARIDPLVVSALPDQGAASPAAAGHEGRLTLQVISYRTRQEANIFAEALRKRGHRAYVIAGDVPDRGTHWRVRIGPFETRREAESYRATFEREEGMNTFIVRNR